MTYYIYDNTSITPQYIYQHMNYKMLSEAQISPYVFGTLPKDFTMTDPASRPYEADNNDAFVSFQKRFNPNWDMKAQVSNVNCNSKGAIFWVYGKNEEDPDILDRYYVYDAMKYNKIGRAHV